MTPFEIYSGRVRVRVAALIVRENCIVLVKQNVPTIKDPVWMPPGGGINPGETAEEALIREVSEETGLHIRPVRLRYIHEFIQGDFHSYELYYVAQTEGGKLITGTDPEHLPDEQLIRLTKWVPVQQLSEMELFPEFLRDQTRKGVLLDTGISHFSTT